MSTLEMIVEDLKALPPPKLEEAASLIHGLRGNGLAKREEALRQSSSILSSSDGAELEKIIAENCERIDPNEW